MRWVLLGCASLALGLVSYAVCFMVEAQLNANITGSYQRSFVLGTPGCPIANLCGLVGAALPWLLYSWQRPKPRTTPPG